MPLSWPQLLRSDCGSNGKDEVPRASSSLLYASSPTHQCISGGRWSLHRVSPQYLHLYKACLPQTVHVRRIRAISLKKEVVHLNLALALVAQCIQYEQFAHAKNAT